MPILRTAMVFFPSLKRCLIRVSVLCLFSCSIYTHTHDNIPIRISDDHMLRILDTYMGDGKVYNMYYHNAFRDTIIQTFVTMRVLDTYQLNRVPSYLSGYFQGEKGKRIWEVQYLSSSTCWWFISDCGLFSSDNWDLTYSHLLLPRHATIDSQWTLDLRNGSVVRWKVAFADSIYVNARPYYCVVIEELQFPGPCTYVWINNEFLLYVEKRAFNEFRTIYNASWVDSMLISAANQIHIQ